MQPDFQMSADAHSISKHLQSTQIGQTVTYEELSKIIGRDIKKEAKSALYTALKHLQKESRFVFGTIKGEGIKRLDNAEIVSLSDKARNAIRRTARRTVKKIVCADYDKLTNEFKIKHNAAISVFGVMTELTFDKSMRKIEQKITATGESLPVAKAAIEALGL